MNAFQSREWRRYRRAALGRHGVHSPFVYRFIEEALRSELPVDVREAFRGKAKSEEQFGEFATLFRCAKFFSDESAVRDRYSLDFIKTESEVAKKMPLLAEGIALLVPEIHQSEQRRALWDRLCTDERANLSVDLWHFGLLLFRDAFKAKQHFVLRVRE